MKAITTTISLPILLLGTSTVFAQDNMQKAKDDDPLIAVASQGAKTKIEIVAGRNLHAMYIAGATKNDSRLINLPMSARVLSSELMQEAGVSTLSDALDLASGIQRQSNLGGLWDSYAIRGFTGDPNFGSDYMVNGINSSRGYNGQRDNANTQTIEILKGPASALYGRGEPGGTINIITKKPRFERSIALNVEIASAKRRRNTVDLTGPINENFAFRLNFSNQSSQSSREYQKSERAFLAPSLLWRINDHTRASYESELVEQNSLFDRGVLAVKGQLGVIPNTRFLGEPNDGPIKVRSNGHQFLVQHEITPQVTLQAALSYRDSSLRGFSTEASSLLSDNQTLRRQRRFRDFTASDRSARFEFSGNHRISGVQNLSLLGVEHVNFSDERIQMRRNPSASNPYSINIYSPVYGTLADPLTLSINTMEKQESNAIYFQDQIELNSSWRALIGVRVDRYQQEVENRRNFMKTTQSIQSNSPRIGAVYQFNGSQALYLSMSSSFRPNSGVSISGQSFAPERGRSYEVGFKSENLSRDLSSTIALFNIEKSNVLTTNPLNTDFSVAAGELKSTGLELDFEGKLFDDLRLSAAYAFTDSKVSRGDNLIISGSRFPNVPRQSANIFIKQKLFIKGAPSSLGMGFHYVGERFGDVAVTSSFVLPAYTTVKLVGDYEINKNTKINFYVNNLLNRQFYTSAYSPMWVQPGSERQFGISLITKL